ncbi:hypothetical protein GCM10007389_17090 [Pontibacter akesuensis]|nr:hypothetical protein GCM10007389_17090 [Pontibacter akesuensis]
MANQLFAQGKATITGKISNPLSGYIELITVPNPLIPEEQQVQVALNGNTFRIEVPVTGAVVAELVHGEEVVPVYLEPGYDLSLSFNGNRFLKTLKYTGTGANENNFLAAFTTRYVDEEDFQVLPDNIKLLEGEFAEFLEYRRNDQMESLEKFTDKKPLSENFKSYILAEIEFGYAKDKLSYHPLRQQVMRATITRPSASFYTYLEKLDMQRPANLISSAFISFLPAYTAHYTREAGHTSKDKEYYQQAYTVAAERLQGQAQLMAQTHILKQSIKLGHLKYTQQMLEDFTAKSSNTAVNAYLAEQFRTNKSLVIGSVAGDFTSVNLAGDTVALSDLKEQVVYLSFLRNNCALCTIEQPHLEQLATKLQGRKVVFLTVHLAESEQQWREKVQGKKLQASHVFVAPAQQKELAQLYGLSDGPAYFLLDQEGRFISTKARHPNDTEVVNDILEHLSVKQASLK